MRGKRLEAFGSQPLLVGDQVLPVFEPIFGERFKSGIGEDIALKAMGYILAETTLMVRLTFFAPRPIDFRTGTRFLLTGVNWTLAAEYAAGRNST